jgi:tetratricopeptide (TPR) repeat protein
MELIEQFELEFNNAVTRYVSDRYATVNLPAKAAFVFENVYEEWKQIEYAWDRKRCIFTALDGVFGETLALWQLAARLIDDRFPEKGLELAIKNATDTDLLTPEFWATVSKANFILRNYEDAEEDIKKCLGLDENNQMGLIMLADIYYWAGKTEEALQIYHKILNSNLTEERKKDLRFSELVGFTGGLVFSPMYAYAWLKEDKNATESAWAWAENEFYFSPQFRSQHAYWLIKNQNATDGFKKILYLSQEMPFFREAVVNASQLISQFNLETQLSEEKSRLDKLIVANNWAF